MRRSRQESSEHPCGTISSGESGLYSSHRLYLLRGPHPVKQSSCSTSDYSPPSSRARPPLRLLPSTTPSSGQWPVGPLRPTYRSCSTPSFWSISRQPSSACRLIHLPKPADRSLTAREPWRSMPNPTLPPRASPRGSGDVSPRSRGMSRPTSISSPTLSVT